MYYNTLKKPKNLSTKKALGFGFIGGFLLMLLFVLIAAIFFFGALLIKNDHCTIEEMYRCLFSIVFGALSVVTSTVVIPDLNKATVSLERIFNVIETRHNIDAYSDKGLTPEDFKGKIEFKNVKFAYPSRPTEIIYENLNLTIKPGKKIGLVGESGCGKSTIF